MSYIDTFDHEFIAYFGHIPVYRPLVSVAGSPNDYDFGCNPEDLILGGGSGEHPAILFTNPAIAVAHFMTSWSTVSEENNTERWSQWLDPLVTQPYSNFIHFAGWTAEDFYRFGLHCRSEALLTPFKPEVGALEAWLASNVGELFFFAMPELVPDLERHLPGARQAVRPIHGNMLIAPPGFPTLGRKTTDGKIKWGHSRWG